MSSSEKENLTPNKNTSLNLSKNVNRHHFCDLTPTMKHCSQVKQNRSLSKERVADGEREENDAFTSRVSYLEQETERLIARLQTSFTRSSTLLKTSIDETNPLEVETDDISDLINEMMQILSPNYTSDADENKWDDEKSPLNVGEIINEGVIAHRIFPATLHARNNEKDNLHAENEDLRMMISNDAKLLQTLSSSCDQANALIVSMDQLLQEKDQALHDMENFVQMNDMANKSMVDKTRKRYSDQVFLLQEKLRESIEQKKGMEKKMKSIELRVAEYKTALSEKQHQFIEIAHMLEMTNESLRLMSSETTTSMHSRILLRISELVNAASTQRKTATESDGCLPTPKKDIEKSQAEVKEEKLLIKSLFDRNAELQDCLTNQLETTDTLMSIKDEALTSVNDLTNLVHEKEAALVEMSELLKMNNQANEKILTHANDKYTRQLAEKEMCIQNLFRIIQRQQFGESEHFRKLIKEKEKIQRDLASIKLEEKHNTMKSTKEFDFMGVNSGILMLILSVFLYTGWMFSII